MIKMIVGGRQSGKTTLAMNMAKGVSPNPVVLTPTTAQARKYFKDYATNNIVTSLNNFNPRGIYGLPLDTPIVIEEIAYVDQHRLKMLLSDFEKRRFDSIILTLNPRTINRENLPYWYKLYQEVEQIITLSPNKKLDINAVIGAGADPTSVIGVPMLYSVRDIAISDGYDTYAPYRDELIDWINRRANNS